MVLNRLSTALQLALLALLLAAPLLGLYPVFVMKLLCFALFACAFNLLLGFTGLLSFGHAAFFGFSAYVTGWLIKAQAWSPELALLAGAATGAGLGAVFGLVAIRYSYMKRQMMPAPTNEIAAPFAGRAFPSP